MINLEKSKKILQQNGIPFTEEEVKKIRDLLYKVCNLEYKMYIANKPPHRKQRGIETASTIGESGIAASCGELTKIKLLKTKKNAKSHYLHKSINR